MKKIIAIILTIAFSVSACAPALAPAQPIQPTAAPAQTASDAAQPVTKVELAENLLEIQLDENPTTGYTWKMTPGTADIVRCIQDSYEATLTPELQVGSGGVHTWVFEGIKPGTDVLQFVHGQHWEGGELGDTKLIEIRVDENLAPAIVDAETEETVEPTGEQAVLGKMDVIEVTLEENATTGYVWSVAFSPEDAFGIVEDTFVPPTGDAVGAPGTHNWKIAKLKEGEGKITFGYARPWQSKLPLKSVTYTVDASNKISVENSEELNSAAELDYTQILLDSMAYALKMSGKKEFQSNDAQLIWSVLYDHVLWLGEKGLSDVVRVETDQQYFFVTQENLQNIYFSLFATGQLPQKVEQANFFGTIKKQADGYYFALSDKGENNAVFKPADSLVVQVPSTDQAVMLQGQITYWAQVDGNYGYVPYTDGAFLLRPNPKSLGGYAIESFSSILS